MIHVKNISKSFPGKANFFGKKTKIQAISNVSFSAEDGKITGLLGANGAGKSTTLRIISTLSKPESGEVVVDGFNAEKDSRMVRQNIGFLPHNSGIYPRLTGIENIRYYAEIVGMVRSDIDRRIEDLVEQLDMSSFVTRRTEGFSQGQRTKVALARALVHKPQTIILDEPTNGLDVTATRNLRKIIRNLKDEGHCVLFSSHVMQEVAALCDSIAIIHEGEIAMGGDVESIKRQTGQSDLEEAFIVAIGDKEEGQS